MLERDRPPRAVRRRARGGRARARRDGLSDPRHAGLAARRVPGDPQRDRSRALARTSPTRRCATSSATTATSPRRRIPDVADRVLSLPKVEALRDAQPVSLDGARARFGAPDLGRGAPAAADDAAGAGGRDARRAADRRAAGAAAASPAATRSSGSCARSSGASRSRTSASARATTWWCGAVRLDDVRGFVFDIDGTLVHRAGAEVHVIPGAREVLERIAASGRPFALFTNGSHLAPDAFARRAARRRAAGRGRAGAHAALLRADVPRPLPRRGARPAVRDRAPRARTSSEAGVQLVDGANGAHVDAVFVAHADEIDFEQLERAARAVIAGARLLTGSYVPAYAGANGPILSRGAMITAAIAKASGARPDRRRQAVAGGGARDGAAARRAARGDRGGRRRRPPRRRARPARRLDDGPRPQRHQRARSTSTACPRSAAARPDGRHRRGAARHGCDARVGIDGAGRAGGPAASSSATCASRAPARCGSPSGLPRCNPTDIALRQRGAEGLPPPWVPGMDAAGTSSSRSGRESSSLAVGDEVMAAVTPRRPEGGAQAELLVVPAASVVAVPAGATLEQASTLPMNGLTALRGLELLDLAPGETLARHRRRGPARLLRDPAREAARASACSPTQARPTRSSCGASAPTSCCRAATGSGGGCPRRVPGGVDAVFDTALLGRSIFPAIRDGRCARVRQDLGRRRRRGRHHDPPRLGRRRARPHGLAAGAERARRRGACSRCASPRRSRPSGLPTRTGRWRPAACAAAPSSSSTERRRAQARLQEKVIARDFGVVVESRA